MVCSYNLREASTTVPKNKRFLFLRTLRKILACHSCEKRTYCAISNDSVQLVCPKNNTIQWYSWVKYIRNIFKDGAGCVFWCPVQSPFIAREAQWTTNVQILFFQLEYQLVSRQDKWRPCLFVTQCLPTNMADCARVIKQFDFKMI